MKKTLHFVIFLLVGCTVHLSAQPILSIVLQSPAFQSYVYSEDPNLAAHAQVTRQGAAEGTVLLKNNGVLANTKDIHESSRIFQSEMRYTPCGETCPPQATFH